MKKLLCILCIIAITITLSACGENGTGETSSAPSTAGSAPGADPVGVLAQAQFFTVDEAAEINASIRAGDVNLIQFQSPPSGNPVAVIHTTSGDITIVLYPEQAPMAVENFITHAQNGYFDGMTFYRVIEDFIIQSGAPEFERAISVFTDEDGEPAFFASEFSLDLWNFRGALVMANASTSTVLRPNSNTSEFFIVQADYVSADVLETMREAGVPEAVIEKYAEVGGVPGFDWRNTVFGMVIEGMDVVDEIASGDTNQMHTPYDPAVIDRITIRN